MEFINGDCMDYMKDYPDNYFDLAIVDPPYGAGFTEGGGCKGWFSKYHQINEGGVWRTSDKTRFGGWFDRYKDGRNMGEEIHKKIITWDVAPDKEYFTELFRISRNQIIWGGNYFELPATRCFLIWRKLSISESFSMAMAEYAWTSFNENAKLYECTPQGKKDDPRFHPTQKPVELYKWILHNYAKKGDKILDTHVGSGSSLIACEQMGFECVGYEIDPEYYEKACRRIKRETAQMTLWDMGLT